MGKLSGDRLLQRAIRFAVNDRVELSDAYSRRAPEHEQFRQQARDFEGLSGRELASLTQEERKLAFQVFVCAEQWEQSLADSHHLKGEVAARSMRNVRLFRAFRRAEFGRTQMEVIYAESTSVDVRDLVEALATHPKGEQE